jgi:hypothetical protein
MEVPHRATSTVVIVRKRVFRITPDDPVRCDPSRVSFAAGGYWMAAFAGTTQRR